jgi:hypothetical protein
MNSDTKSGWVLPILLLVSVVSTTLHATGSFDHSLFSKVLKDHVVNGTVDYAGIKEDKRFDQYLAALSKVDPYEIKDDTARLVFWINAYNAFTIKLINDHYPVQSIRDIVQGEAGPWDIVWIDLGGKKYSLNHIEHEIIRKEHNEPRIHFALVCAAKSCPPLRSEAYVAGRLDRQLDDNARVFLFNRTHNRFDESSGTLYLSEIFSWFGEDFVERYGSAQQYVLSVLGLADVRPAEVKYIQYDWRLNGR